MQSPCSEEDLLKFMDITGCCNLEKAVSYIQMGENKLDTAIQLYMDFEQSQSHNLQQKGLQDQQQQRSTIQATPKIKVQSSYQDIHRQPQDAALIEKYQKHLEDKRAKEDGIIKKTIQFGSSVFSYFFTPSPNHGSEFQKYLQQNQIKTEIAFQSGNFQEKLQKANQDTRPLLVYLHNHQSVVILQKMSNCKNFVSNINKIYSIIGFLSNQQVYEQLPHKPDPPIILIYKLDIFDEVVLMQEISLSMDTNFEDVTQKIKTIRAAFNKEYIQMEGIKIKANSSKQQAIRFESYQYNQVQDNGQKEVQRERDLLIQSQKEAYRFAEQQAIEKKRKDEELKLQEQAIQIVQQQKEEQRLLKKAQLLSNLPEEPQNSQSISILFRFINATRTRRFNFNDKIKNLFDFVQSQEDDCFHDPHANIDLIQNFPRLSLKDKTGMNISEVFIDSEMEQLIVDEQE